LESDPEYPEYLTPNIRMKFGRAKPNQLSIKVMTLHVSKGLERTGRRRAHARRGRRRARGSAAVLRGGYAGDAAVGDWGEWGREVRRSHI